VWVGGAFTSVVFIAAAYGAGLFFQNAGEPTALGFTSSLVAVIFLAYFLAAVFLFGAEVTKVYSDRLYERETSPAPGRLQSGDPQVLVAEPPTGVPRAALVAFLAGLVVGWRRRGR
jgi:hypothetical protein